MQAAEGKYYLFRLAIGHDENIEIEESDYISLSKSREVLFEITSLEEKFFAICEHYREIEEFIFKSSLTNMVFGLNSVPEIHSIGAQFGRLTGSFLSSVRLYQDALLSHISAISENTVPQSDMKAHLSEEYDSHLAYRVMEAIRNHAQHRAFPVHSTKFGGKWNKEFTEMSFYSEFFFEVSRIEDDPKFKKSIKTELMDIAGNFDLKLGVRNYFGCICRIHRQAQDLVKPFQEKAVQAFTEARTKWASAHSDNEFLAVAACKLHDGILVDGYKKVHISPQIEEYRESLSKKTRHMQNMEIRKIVF